MRQGSAVSAILLLALLASCGSAQPRPDEQIASKRFPEAHRPVAPIVSSRFSTEEERDRIREADTVMHRAAVKKGMTVADIGAGEGYYTTRLAQRVGKHGRVLAQDIIPAVRDALAERVTRERLDNVSVKLGLPADPKLPAASFDRVFMVHMYHEIAQPYEFLWRLRPALRPGGRLVVVDADRPTSQHGTPPDLLDCEMRAVGYTRVARSPLTAADAYFTLYEAKGPRPEPEAISSCTLMMPAGVPAR